MSDSSSGSPSPATSKATESYASLFIFATLGNFVAIILALLRWKTLTDRNTPLLEATSKQFRLRLLAGIGILLGLVPVVWFMLQRPDGTETLIKGICAAVALTLIYLTVRHPDRRERRNMTAYLILTLGSLAFWSLYQMAPSGLMLFAVHNVNLMIGKVEIQPQWIQNINTVCIVLGGPLLASLFTRTARARMEDRHTEAVCDVADLDGAGLSHSPVRHQAGRRRRQECVRVAVHELCAAERR